MAQEKKSNPSKKDDVKSANSKSKNVVANASSKTVPKKNKKKKVTSDLSKKVSTPKVAEKKPVKEENISKGSIAEKVPEKTAEPEIVLGLNRESQKYYRTLTKLVSIFALLGKILTCIAIPVVFIAAIFFTVIINKIDYSENRLYYDKREVAVFETDSEGVALRINSAIEDKNIIIHDNIIIRQIQNLLESIPKGVVVSAIVFVTVFFEICLILWINIYRKLERLFNRLYEEDTPFTEKSANDIRTIGKLLIVSMVVLALGNGLTEIMLHANLTIHNGSISIISILVVYTLYYIFKYGVKLQAKSNMRIANKK